MAHTLIVGMSESGKTTLAKMMCAKSNQVGRGTLVLDPIGDQWAADFQTRDEKLFLDTFWASRSCDAFIDEAGDTVGQYDKAMARMATRGRHWGHNCHFITQRAQTVSLTVRSQCRYIFLFALARQDCEVYAREFNKPELIEASQLNQFECFFAARFGGEIRRFNILGESSNASSNSDRSSDLGGGHTSEPVTQASTVADSGGDTAGAERGDNKAGAD